MNKELEDRIMALEQEVQNLKASATIPYEVDSAFRDRLGISDLIRLDTSTKTTASETQAVSEGGSGTYNVAKPFDAFKQYTIAGTTVYIPVYTDPA